MSMSRLRIAAACSALLVAMSAGGTGFGPEAGRHPEDVHTATARRACRSTRKRRSSPRADDGVFNNLVMFDQHVQQNSLQSIVPDLATGWSWNEDGTELTFPLRQGVKWHDGKPFTAKDVKCTWDLLTGKSSEKLRVNPRKSWYQQPRAGHHERRLRGHLSSEAAAAGLSRRCSPPGSRRSIPATCRRARCASIRSAPARSNSSSSSRTSTSR